MTDPIVGIIFLVGTGLLEALAGILIRIGISKIWFLAERVPAIVMPSFAHGLFPMGLGSITLGLLMYWDLESEVTRILLCSVVCPLFLLGMVFAVWDPWWLQPAWYRWLKEYHSNIIPILQEEGRAMGRWEWQRRVATQKGLEQWVDEVRQKRGLG
jgi:hypothetical protein